VTSRPLALFRFHLAGGARVASRNAIATIGLIIIVLGSAPDPLLWLRFLALGVAGSGAGSGPLVGLTLIALGLARDAVPRLTLGLGGWTRSLPVTGVHHRRGVTYALPIIQLPLAAAVAIAAVLVVTLYHVPLSGPKLLGAPLALVAAGAAMVPARRSIVSGPLFVASALAASLGHWTTLAASIGFFALADLIAGPVQFPARRIGVPAAPGGLRTFRFTWRAVGWRLLAPLPMPALALAAAWFYTRNNELTAPDVGFVARLWSVIALALYTGAVADIVVSRRPPWPWLRSLPWSSTARTVDDAVAIGAPGVVIALAAGIVDPRTAFVALATLPPVAVMAVLLVHGARRRLTRTSGALLLIGIVLGTAAAYYPAVAVLALISTPLLVRAAARRDRREIVTGWQELHHDAIGDSLAWSAR
jgi:hypothetical protein